MDELLASASMIGWVVVKEVAHGRGKADIGDEILFARSQVANCKIAFGLFGPIRHRNPSEET